MAQPLRRPFVLAAASSVATLLLAAAAFAFVAAPRDFSPFTMVVTEWTAELGSQPDGSLVAGTVVERLEYRSVRDWSVTVVSHSLDPRYEGSTKTVKDDERNLFDALTRHTFSRIALGEDPEVPGRWLIPGLMDVLPERGFTRSAGAEPGTLLFELRELVDLYDRQGSAIGRIEVVTNAIFDAATGLPMKIESYRDGALSRSTAYVVVSRP